MIRFRSNQRTVTGSITVGAYNGVHRKKVYCACSTVFRVISPYFVVFVVIRGFRGYFTKNLFFRVFDVISPRVILPEPTRKRGALIQMTALSPV